MRDRKTVTRQGSHFFWCSSVQLHWQLRDRRFLPAAPSSSTQLCLTARPFPKRTSVYRLRLHWPCGQKPLKLHQGKKPKLFLPHPIPHANGSVHLFFFLLSHTGSPLRTSILAQGWAELTYKYHYAEEHPQTPSTSSPPAAEMQNASHLLKKLWIPRCCALFPPTLTLFCLLLLWPFPEILIRCYTQTLVCTSHRNASEPNRRRGKLCQVRTAIWGMTLEGRYRINMTKGPEGLQEMLPGSWREMLSSHQMNRFLKHFYLLRKESNSYEKGLWRLKAEAI